MKEAKAASESGQLEEALRLFAAICDSDPTNLEAWREQAYLLVHFDRYKEAAESYQKVIDLDEKSPEAWIGLANALRLHDPPRAIAPSEHAVKLAPENAEAWLILGLSFNNTGEYARSVDAFEHAFKLNPEFAKDTGMLLRRAESLVESRRPKEAIPLLDLGLEQIDSAKQEKPEQKASDQNFHGQLLLQKGVALLTLKAFGEAVEVLRRSAELLPDGLEKSLAYMNESFGLSGLNQPKEALAALDKAAAIAPQNWIRGRIGLEQGAILNNLSRHAEAEAPLDRALEFLPSEGGLAHLRAQAWFQKGVTLNSLLRRDEAIEAFDKMAEVTAELPPPMVATASFHKAVAQNILGRHQEALATFATSETELLQSPLAPWVHFQKAIAFDALGQSDAALAELTAASESAEQPGAMQIPVATLSYQKAVALMKQGRAEEALAALDEAAKADPGLLDNLKFWLTHAILCFQLNRLEEVIAPSSAVLADHPLVLAFQGNAFVALGRLPEAMDAWQKALSPEGTPRAKEADAWMGFGMARMFGKEAREGLAALDRAVALDPNLDHDPNIRMLRALGLASAGRHEEALESTKGALDIEPVWLVRGIALGALNRPKEALEAFENGLAVAKKSPSQALANVYTASIGLQKGLLLVRTDQNSLALEAFEQAMESGLKISEADPNYIMSVLGKGWALDKLGRLDKAEHSLGEAAELSKALPDSFPHRGVACWSFGEFLLRQEREEEAIQAFTQSLVMQPDNVDSLLGRGRAYLALEDFERAEADFANARNMARDDQDVFDALLDHGQSLNRLNRNDEALTVYREAVRFLSKEVRQKWRLWLNLGETYQELGRQQAALRAFQQGWRQDKRPKKSSSLALGIGAMLLETKRDEEALVFLQEAKRKAEPDGRLDFNLGLAYYRRQQPEKARGAWADAAKKNVAQAEEVLRETEGKQAASAASTNWMHCWFGKEQTRSRKFAGALLIFLLALVCALPLLKEDCLPWLNTGRDWTTTVTAVVVLVLLILLPTVKRLSFSKDSLEVEIEPERPETSPVGPTSESLLRRLTAIGLSLQGTNLSPTQVPRTIESRSLEAAVMLKQVPMPGTGASSANY